MWIFHQRWIAYHFVSSITAVIGFLLASILLFEFELAFSSATIFNTLAIALVVSALSAILGSFYSSKHNRRNMEEISLGAKHLAYGNLDYRLTFAGDAQFDQIVIAFNEMAERLESQVQALQKLAEENEQLLQETKVTAISEERQRLARDLHDAVSQQLFAISMLSATAMKIGQSEPAKTRELMEEISQSAVKAQAEMRALLLQLRPLTLQNENLAQALESLATELKSKQTIECQTELDPDDLPKNIENQLFRIAQESLSNVLRHAEATKVKIGLSISQSNHRVILTIEDNGKGFNPREIPKSSIGIRSIKERTTILGGTAQWLTVPGQGTKVEIRVPISADWEGE